MQPCTLVLPSRHGTEHAAYNPQIGEAVHVQGTGKPSELVDIGLHTGSHVGNREIRSCHQNPFWFAKRTVLPVWKRGLTKCMKVNQEIN